MKIDFLLLSLFISLTLLSVFGNFSNLSVIVGGILFLFFVVSKIIQNKGIILFRSISFYLFLVWILLSFLFNEISGDNLNKLLSLLLLITLSVLIANIVNSSFRVKLIYIIILASTATLSIILLLEYFNIIGNFILVKYSYIDRYEQTVGAENIRYTVKGTSVNYFSYIILSSFVISSGLISYNNKKSHNLLLIFISCIFIYIIILTASLTSIIALALFVMLFYSLKFQFKKLSHLFFLLVISVCLYFAYENYQLILSDSITAKIELVLQRFSPEEIYLSGFNKAFSSRGGIWIGGISMASDNIMFGVGLENYRHDIIEYIPHSDEAGWISRDAHNLFLDIALSIGMPGLLFFTLFLFKLSYTLYKNLTPHSSIFINKSLFIQFNLLFISLIVGLTSSIIWYKYFWIALGLSFAVLRINNNRGNSAKKTPYI